MKTFKEFLEESYKGYYHGTNADFKSFSLEANRVNRGTNVSGIYFTKRESEALSYGPRIIKADLNVNNPFHGQKKNKITQKMEDKTLELLKKHTHYKEDWILTAILPDFVKDGNFRSLRDISGDIKREIILAGGYDSYIDGDHVVVLDPKDITVL